MTKWIRIASLACALLVSALTVRAQEARQIQGFSVVLILGEAEGNAAPDGLSVPARKALADIKDFLPYKGYRVLDTQWIAGTDRTPHMEVQLRGMNDQDYEWSMSSQRADGGTAISATVTLGTPRMSDQRRGEAMARMAALEARIRSGPPKLAENEREVEQLKRAIAGGQILINTTLRMSVGETVVVGTSRVQGDKALIVLLTAVARQ